MNPRVCLIDGNNDGLATMFVLAPPGFPRFSEGDLLRLTHEQVSLVREFNIGFGKYIITESTNHRISFFFTSSRSYSLPGTDIKVGALKVFPMSVFLNCHEVERISDELDRCIAEYFDKHSSCSAVVAEARDLFRDMSRPE